ncbi:hypothetical protein TSAR_006020 [Trichomalopsis sarcophagae]|uniref:Uncharacterized protein n=1 Tax=Trichomalopsis sarcophagae TaxID=543379 RepID=A0A232EEM0_9HYME|nr:hypothetical protein TSAR_006020 [Trichomalopsis sarcophagae]
MAIEACDAKCGCPTGRGALMVGRIEGPGWEKPRDPQLKRNRAKFPVPNAGPPNARESDEALDLTREQRLLVPNVDHLMASRWSASSKMACRCSGGVWREGTTTLNRGKSRAQLGKKFKRTDTSFAALVKSSRNILG